MTKEKLLEKIKHSTLRFIEDAIIEDDFEILELYTKETFELPCNQPIPDMIKNYLRTKKLKQYD